MVSFGCVTVQPTKSAKFSMREKEIHFGNTTINTTQSNKTQHNTTKQYTTKHNTTTKHYTTKHNTTHNNHLHYTDTLISSMGEPKLHTPDLK